MVCPGCGCVVSIKLTAVRSKEREDVKSQDQPGGSFNESAGGGVFLNSASEEKTAADPAEAKPAKKKINVFGPVSLVLGILSIVFAVISGINSLVICIPAIILSCLAIMAAVLLKNVRRWVPIAALILSVIGLILALVLHTGLVF